LWQSTHQHFSLPLVSREVCKANAKQSNAKAKQSNANAKQSNRHIPPFTDLTNLQGKHDNIYKYLHIFTINFFIIFFRVTQPN
jgi:hypothetical protein